jgi:hypothetical protein
MGNRRYRRQKPKADRQITLVTIVPIKRPDCLGDMPVGQTLMAGAGRT